MLSKNDKTKVSKFMSFALRHDPAAAGITLDAQGWVALGDLLVAVQRNVSPKITTGNIIEVVEENDKQRFAIRDGMIRANQGHSTEVDLKLADAVPPDMLYHGTSANFAAAIQQEGLLKMARHAVHLSIDIETATKVGQRRNGGLIIYVIDAKRMNDDGHKFQVSDNGVWLTDAVPAEYLSVYS